MPWGGPQFTLTPPPGCLGQTHIPAPYGLGCAHPPSAPPLHSAPTAPAPYKPWPRPLRPRPPPFPSSTAPWHRPQHRPSPALCVPGAQARVGARRLKLWRRAGGWCCVRRRSGRRAAWRLTATWVRARRRAAGGGRRWPRARASRRRVGGPVRPEVPKETARFRAAPGLRGGRGERKAGRGGGGAESAGLGAPEERGPGRAGVPSGGP